MKKPKRFIEHQNDVINGINGQRNMFSQSINASGSAIFFSISDKDNHTLNAHEVLSDRIRPDQASNKLVGSSISGPLFCECRNYFKLPKSGKGGLLCAYTIPTHPMEWKLGIMKK